MVQFNPIFIDCVYIENIEVFLWWRGISAWYKNTLEVFSQSDCIEWEFVDPIGIWYMGYNEAIAKCTFANSM